MNVPELLAYCGLMCHSCPIYWTTREPNQQHRTKMRNRIAELCNELYKSDLKGEDVNDCDGCRTESGRLFSGCRDCEIRKCAQQKEMETCAHCPEYVCIQLQKHFDMDPTGRSWLEVIRCTI